MANKYWFAYILHRRMILLNASWKGWNKDKKRKKEHRHPHWRSQVSVERLLSAMKLLLTDLRSRLKEDILEVMLLIRCNRE